MQTSVETEGNGSRGTRAMLMLGGALKMIRPEHPESRADDVKVQSIN